MLDSYFLPRPFTCARPLLKRPAGVGDGAGGAVACDGLLRSPSTHAWAGPLGPWWPAQSPLGVRRQGGAFPAVSVPPGLGPQPPEAPARRQAGVSWGLRFAGGWGATAW